MGRISFRQLVGIVKDKATLSKAAVLSNTSQITLLRATTHSPPAPPDDQHISALLFLGDGSRATASAVVSSLMDRLHRTGNCVVALKCLLVIHHIIKRGPFILQDQLSIFPTAGGYNYLKLSAFRDGATASTWALSAWVRFYARYLETQLSTSRVLGYFLCSGKENQEQRISSFLNSDLIKDVDSLVSLIEEMCKAPDSHLLEGNLLVREIMVLLSNDFLSVVNEISLRIDELKQRLSCLSFGDSVELVCALKRLQDCKERSSVLCVVKKPSIEKLWASCQDLKDKIGMLKVYREGGKILSLGRTDRVSESARFERRVFGNGDSVLFQSCRFGTERFSKILVVKNE